MKIVVRAASSVEEGEEVELNYFIGQGSSIKSEGERQPELMLGYGRCVDGE